MSTSVSFACNLIAALELLHVRGSKPFAGYCVATGRRIEIEAGEWGDGGLTGQSMTTGTAVNHFHHSTDRVVVNRRLRNVARRGEAKAKRTKQVVTVEDRFGDLDLSLKSGATRPGQIVPTEPAEI
jgi:hypothetical protein